MHKKITALIVGIRALFKPQRYLGEPINIKGDKDTVHMLHRKMVEEEEQRVREMIAEENQWREGKTQEEIDEIVGWKKLIPPVSPLTHQRLMESLKRRNYD